jgi:HD-GYP domain-containing protein (c-di-GMP phosphodiesterase class II)
MVVNGRVAGLLFFNSRKKNSFTPRSLDVLDLFAHLITNVATAGLRTAGVMTAALQTANEMVHYRDPETGNHLERMARYSRLVAQELARTGLYRFDDEQIQTIESFAPLHDVGKLGIPDNVLLKPGSLTAKERKIMRSHTTQGRRIIDAILHNFKLESLHRVDALRHIAEHHHEAMDGSGYPHGLKGNKIPIEARIIAVADIFDALTSVRPYKSAWTNDRAFRYLRRLSRTKLDRDCVQALLHNRHAVEDIQARFRDSQAPAPAALHFCEIESH